jgi:hypothetical protein
MDAVAGPIGPQGSVERPVRCLFCGAISAWWSCGCEWAVKIRDDDPDDRFGEHLIELVCGHRLRLLTKGGCYSATRIFWPVMLAAR